MMTPLSLLLVLIASPARAQLEYTATDSDVELRFEAPDSGPCRIEASENPSMTSLVPAVDPAVVPGADIESGAGRWRSFRLGRRAGAIAGNSLVPLWLEPAHTYHVRIQCGAEAPITGVVRTEPKGERAVSAGCNYSLPAPRGRFPSSGGTYTVPVSAPAGCAWAAGGSAAWARVGNGASGTGNGAVTVVIDPNNSAERFTDLVIAGLYFRLTQEGGPPAPAPLCNFSLYSSGSWFLSGGGQYTIDVPAPAGCYWQASPSAAWITNVRNVAGFGPDSIAYSVEANSTATLRASKLTIGTQEFTINQMPGPWPPPCDFVLSSNGSWFPPQAGNYSLTVLVRDGCGWTAASSVPWARITAGTSGSGNGVVSFTVDANLATGYTRTGELRIGTQVFQISQTAAVPTVCTYSLSSSEAWSSAEGGTFLLGVTAPPGCAWQSSAGVPWIRILEGASGSGAASVRFSVEQNPGAARSGTITIAGQTFTLSQPAYTCTFTVSFTSSWFPATGGAYSVAVYAPTACSWTAVSSASWLRLTSGASGAGNGVVSFLVDPNPSSARTATLRIGDRVIELNQGGGYVASTGCSATFNSNSSWFPSNGGSYSLGINTPAQCFWQASSNASWVRITGAASGYGSAAISYTVDPNGQTMRTAEITAAGQTFTVNQAAPACYYQLSFLSSWFPASGGTYSISVGAPAGCSWASTASVDWLRIESGATGSGPGSVRFTLEPSTAIRNTTLLVAGQPVVIYQTSR